MDRTKMSFAISLAVFFFAAAFAASSVMAAGPGGWHGRFGHDPLFRLLHRLDLTDAQKADVANILQTNEKDAKAIAIGLANARAQVAKNTLKGSYNDNDFSTLASFQQQAVQLRAKIVAAIIPILSKDQQTTLQNMQSKIGTNINAAIDARFAHLDKWIARHSK